MQQLLFSTGNTGKVSTAQSVCDMFDIQLVPAPVEIIEIQSETGEPIARHKAQEAYRQLQQPLVVTDDSWIIPGLNGFPGPYMKSMNEWFTPEIWLHLTKDLKDSPRHHAPNCCLSGRHPTKSLPRRY